jgi:hypothetical protein
VPHNLCIIPARPFLLLDVPTLIYCAEVPPSASNSGGTRAVLGLG